MFFQSAEVFRNPQDNSQTPQALPLGTSSLLAARIFLSSYAGLGMGEHRCRAMPLWRNSVALEIVEKGIWNLSTGQEKQALGPPTKPTQSAILRVYLVLIKQRLHLQEMHFKFGKHWTRTGWRGHIEKQVQEAGARIKSGLFEVVVSDPWRQSHPQKSTTELLPPPAASSPQ